MKRLVVTGLLLCAACAQPAPPTQQPASTHATPTATATATPARAPARVTIDAATPLSFTVELAVTEPERERGLMFREHMADDTGMLFLFEQQRPLSFWMKNTRIPLDMLFIDESGTIAGIVENAEPMTLTSRRIDKPSRYVLELNGGACRALGITAGQRVHFAGVDANLVDPRVLN